MTDATKFPPGPLYGRDLLGDPVNPRLGMRGRPRHVPTDAMRAQVAELHRQGLAQVAIATALRCTIPTLTRHYWRELGSNSQAWRNRPFKAGPGGEADQFHGGATDDA